MQTDTNIAEKQLKLLRMQTIMTACILAIVLIAGIFAVKEFASLRSGMDMIEQKIETLDVETLNDAIGAFTDAAEQFNSINMDEFNGTVESLQAAAENFGSVNMERFNGTVESLQTAAENFGSVDIDRLNEAVSSLKGAADTFKSIDVEALNSLVHALETVSTRLENAVSAITGIFKR